MEFDDRRGFDNELLVVLDVARKDGVGPAAGDAGRAFQGVENRGRAAVRGVELSRADGGTTTRRHLSWPGAASTLVFKPSACCSIAAAVEAAIDIGIQTHDGQQRWLPALQ